MPWKQSVCGFGFINLKFIEIILTDQEYKTGTLPQHPNRWGENPRKKIEPGGKNIRSTWDGRQRSKTGKKEEEGKGKGKKEEMGEMAGGQSSSRALL